MKPLERGHLVRAAAFPDFHFRMAAATSVNMKISSFPNSIVWHISMGIALIVFVQ